MGSVTQFTVESQLTEKIKKIKLLILDVDGVVTEGRIIYDSKGQDLKYFDARDGVGVLLLRTGGIKTIFISVKGSKAIRYLARDLKVEEVYEGISPKTKVLYQILKKHNVSTGEICYVGDDLVDLGMMEVVGFPVAVANACQEIKDAASYITQKSGGRGAVREIAELIFMTQGKWHELVKIEFDSQLTVHR